MSGITVTMAGVDITSNVSEPTIEIDNALGQGIGAPSESSARAVTLDFVCDLGPMASAVGAGTTVTVPTLVRYGQVTLQDATGAYVFGGFVTQLDDATTAKAIKTKVTCTDYWGFLQTIVVNETYDGETDIFIITDLLTKYAPWIDQSQLPVAATYTFGPEVMQHWTLQAALQKIVDKTGYLMWIDAEGKIHYVNPKATSTAPYNVSDFPNFSTTFGYKVDTWTIDDTSTINRVYFYGGKHLSNDITQDLSIQCNGVNDLFTLAYYPHAASDGSFHIKKNGVEQVIGFVGSTTDALKKDGGSCDVLLNIDAHTVQWSTAPAGGTTVVAIYRREVPLNVIIEDKNSVSYFGKYLDGVISDETVFDSAVAVKRCRTLLFEQSFGLETLEIKTWRTGLQAGQTIRVDNTLRNIHKTYLIQEVRVASKGAGFYEYTVTLGAWNWNIVDVMLALAQRATPDDDSSSAETIPVTIIPTDDEVGVTDSWVTTTHTFGGFYARSTAVGDGHDAYCGFTTVAS